MRSVHQRLPLLAALTAFLLVLGIASVVVAGDHDDSQRVEIEKHHKATMKIVTVDENGERHEEVIEFDGDEPHAFLGVSLEGAEGGGALVNRVIEESAAESAGMREGDRIVAIDGDEVDGPWDVTRRILEAEPGERVDLELLRDGDRMRVTAELGERRGWSGIHLPDLELDDLDLDLDDLHLDLDELREQLGNMKLDVHVPKLGHSFMTGRIGRPRLGVQLVAPTPELREHFGADPETGVLVAKVLDGSPAEEGGVQVGDLIVAIAGQPVRSAGDLVRVLDDVEGEKIELDLIRDGRPRTVDVFIPAEEDDEPRAGGPRA